MLGRVVLVVALFGLLAVAPSADAYIYWTSLDGGNSRLGRADLDGTDVNSTQVGGIPLITAVASDGTYVYWTQSGGPSAIGRATVDGGSVSSPFQNTGNPAFDVAVDGANLHWMYNTGGVPDRAVNRAPKTGGQSPLRRQPR